MLVTLDKIEYYLEGKGCLGVGCGGVGRGQLKLFYFPSEKGSILRGKNTPYNRRL